MKYSESSVGKCYRFDREIVLIKNVESMSDYDNVFKFAYFKADEKDVKSLIADYQVSNLFRNILASDIVYQDILGLVPPLKSKRYFNAKSIIIRMVPSEGNGMAFDEVLANKSSDNEECHLGINLKASIQPFNGTPAHELFHLYQNSAMMFKQSWLSEGLARWAESLFNEGTGNETPLPQNQEQLLTVFDSSYGASKFWTRLFKLVDEDSEFEIPSHLNTITYTDGSPIIKDNKAYGVSFISTLFHELSVESKNVSDEKGWELYAWKEKDQKSSDLNPYIWRAVKRAVYKTIPYEEQSEELRICMEIEL